MFFLIIINLGVIINNCLGENWKGGGSSDTEVTWEDQQNINKFGRLNNRLHDLLDEIKIAKVLSFYYLAFILLLCVAYLWIRMCCVYVCSCELLLEFLDKTKERGLKRGKDSTFWSLLYSFCEFLCSFCLHKCLVYF